ncbi:hypothetical protein NDU88_002030 [Pleurodeles waltl]|uniref:Uncharacterized protein n=1 Tax=Pleurodeles waltl TaxID=8319 RepID=A0AAV7VY72_PLEWA|nr:hypothetical protein NDU88_002030 [Pleurodeles waltl]
MVGNRTGPIECRRWALGKTSPLLFFSFELRETTGEPLGGRTADGYPGRALGEEEDLLSLETLNELLWGALGCPHRPLMKCLHVRARMILVEVQ